jgi:hypothetical protein
VRRKKRIIEKQKPVTNKSSTKRANLREGNQLANLKIKSRSNNAERL